MEKPANWTEMNRAQFTDQMELLKNDQTVQYFDQLHASDWKQFIYMGKEESWYPFDSTKKLTASTFPILLIIGEGNLDELIGLKEWKSKNSNAHIAVIPFAGHLVQTDQAQLYSQILESFLKQFPFIGELKPNTKTEAER
ncbi:alpha/beta fold hydrolase [Paenisporosarcina cavernae]|uniref:alpha/beta fold hydrolase n=1 Tax=Paenisporosarcina cavernae TaxID=2320858 RepID=UPI001EE51D01|nr:alpha/beta hydrolase [Paenisporosarcina cavernae]